MSKKESRLFMSDELKSTQFRQMHIKIHLFKGLLINLPVQLLHMTYHVE